jgi:hypothetical protein
MPALNGDQLPAESRNWGRPGYGPNPKEGTQGMLFSNAHAVNKETRAEGRTGDEVGHRGYSKNRLNAVRESVHVMPSMAIPEANDAAIAAVAAHPEERADAEMGLHVPHEHSPWDAKNNVTRDRIHDMIARSTVPTEHIQQTGGVGTEFDDAPLRVQTTDMGMAAGDYNKSENLIRVHASMMHDRQRAGHETLIHEIGHAVDSAHSRVDPTRVPGETSGAVSFTSPEASATNEGFADAYAIKHARGRGGAEVERGSGPYDVPPYETYGQGSWEEYSGFAHDEELTPLGRAPKAYAESRAVHGAPVEADKPRQLRLFHDDQLGHI